MGKFRDILEEWKARRAGRKFVVDEIRRPVRDITGPTGWVVSRSWDSVDKQGKAYNRSFEPRVPPSLHISERDRTRYNLPIPIVERCIEDWGKDSAEAADETPGGSETTAD